MRGRSTTIGIILVLALFVANDVEAIDIFVWDHNNGIEIRDRIFNNEYLTVCESMTRTLDELGLEYTSSTSMPDDLDDYDLVIINLGIKECG